MLTRSSPSPHSTRTWRWAAMGACVGALLAGVFGAPARWLDPWVQQLTQQRVQLADARGTVWQGSARLMLSAGSGSSERSSLPGRFDWQWGWGDSWLSLGLTLRHSCCTPEPMRLTLQRQDGAWQLNLADQRSQWPLQVLAGLGAPWNTLQAQGQMQWQSQGVRLRRVDGQWLWYGQHTWQLQDLSSRLSMVQPLGSYRIDLHAPSSGSATPPLTLETLRGPLLLKAQGQWTGQGLRLTGEASAEAGHEDALANLLNIIGRREGPRSRFSLG